MSEDRSCQVYIGYLPNDARMEDVEDFFKGMIHTVWKLILNLGSLRAWFGFRAYNVGRVFSIVISSKFHMGWFRDEYHRGLIRVPGLYSILGSYESATLDIVWHILERNTSIWNCMQSVALKGVSTNGQVLYSNAWPLYKLVSGLIDNVDVYIIAFLGSNWFSFQVMER